MTLALRAQWRLVVALAALAGFAWFLSFGGWRCIAPGQIDWLMAGDWSTHELGWLFFRNEGWALPLGRISGLLAPVGTTLGYNDSLPWLGVLFRPFSALLGTDFQYLGPWLAVCFAAQGAAGVALASSNRGSPWRALLGALLFVPTPLLLLRIGHPSLCAHALLVALIWLAVRPISDRAVLRRTLLWLAGITAAASGLHPYLEVMVLVLSAAVLARLAWEGHLRWWQAAAVAAGLGALAFFEFFLFGYLGQRVSMEAIGFGGFSADLLALVNPQEWSRFFKPLPRGGFQYEGMAYLGAGILLLDLALLVSLALRWRMARALPWRRAVPLTVGAVLLALFSLSSQITFEGRTVLDLGALYAPFPQVVGAFRSSGRFIWPLHYLCIAAPVVLLPRLWSGRPWLAPLLFGAGLVAQLADVNSASVQQRWNKPPFERLTAPGWALAEADYQHLAMFPAEVWGTRCRSVYGYREQLVVRLSYEAYRRRLTFNSGYVARTGEVQEQACSDELRAVAGGRLDPETVYVTSPPYLPAFTRAGALCGTLDGLPVCVAPGRSTSLEQLLRSHR